MTKASVNRQPINVALLGCGAVSSTYYAPALDQLERSRIVRVSNLYDPDVNAATELSACFPAARLMKAPDDLSGIDLAIVASPPAFHAQQTIAALRAGIAVLCEKPMALSVEEGESMIDAAVDSRVPLAIGLVRRFLPATQVIRTVLSTNMLGQLRHATCLEGGPFRWPARSRSFFAKSGGGGVLFDLGPHMLDLLVWWLGLPAELQYEDDAMGGVEANCRFRMKYAAFEVEGRLSRDWALPNQYFFDCDNGWFSWTVTDPDTVQIGFHGTQVTLNAHLHESGVAFGRPALGCKAFNFEQSFVAQIRNVVNAIRGVEPLVAPPEDALKSLQLIEHCYRHRTLMGMGWLTDEERAQAMQQGGLCT